MLMQLSCPLVTSKRVIKGWNPIVFTDCTFGYEPKTWMNVALNKVGKLVVLAKFEFSKLRISFLLP